MGERRLHRMCGETAEGGRLMAKPRIKWRLAGFSELRNAPGVLEDLQDRADKIASAAGEGYESRPAEVRKGRTGRGRAVVLTGDFAARRDNAKNNTLLKSLDAGA